jgi:hypothetical protein
MVEIARKTKRHPIDVADEEWACISTAAATDFGP